MSENKILPLPIASSALPCSTQQLAYLGDAVYELLVRSMLVRQGHATPDILNQRAKQYVSAQAQAQLYYKILNALTAAEQAVIKRGRNAHQATRAKNASMSDYRHATGLEVLFGYLYITDRHERLMEIFCLCTDTE